MAASELLNVNFAADSLRELSESVAQHETTNDILHLDLAQASAAVAGAMGKTDEAIATLKEAIRFEQQHPVDYPNVLTPPSAEVLGTLLLKRNRPAEAAVAFQRALELAPNTLHSIGGANTAAKSLHTQR